MPTTLPETSTTDIPLWQLRNRLIDLTVALADELAADGDRDRLEALTSLYPRRRGRAHRAGTASGPIAPSSAPARSGTAA